MHINDQKRLVYKVTFHLIHLLPASSHPTLKKLINKIKIAGEADLRLIKAAIVNEFTLCSVYYKIEDQAFIDALYNLSTLGNSYRSADIIHELAEITSFPEDQVEKKWELMMGQEHDTQKVQAHVVE